MFHFYFENLEQDFILLPPEESKHCVKSLRLKNGDSIIAINGKGMVCTAEITEASLKTCTLKIISRKWIAPSKAQLHIAVAPTKNPDRIEWFVEKAVEIGIEKITILHTERTERSRVQIERLKRISIAAVKQCQGFFIPEIEENTFMDLMETSKCFSGGKWIPHCEQGEKKQLVDMLQDAQDALILIGPEGDFSPKEISTAMTYGFLPVALGNRRLRTETAAVYATVVYKSKQLYYE